MVETASEYTSCEHQVNRPLKLPLIKNATSAVMTKKHVLIIDDEPDICELIEITLSRMGLKTRSALNLTDARILLETESFDLCLTDMRLPDGGCIELVEHVQEHYAKLPIAVITAHGNMESAVKALKAGAFDFVSKPVDIQILRNLVSAATTLPVDFL